MIKQLEYLADHAGDEFEGKVSGFLEFGMFVTLEGIGADGLVRFSTIDDDFYVWDSERWQVRGRRRGRIFKLGDSIHVRVIRTDSERQEIDLEIVQTEAPRGGKTLKNIAGRARHARKRR